MRKSKNLGENPLITNIKIPEGYRTEKATFTFQLKGLNIIEECKEKIPLKELKILMEVKVAGNKREGVALPPSRQCLNCGQEFTPKTYNQRYCNADCNYDHHMKLNAKKKVIHFGNCLWCGQKMEIHSAHQRYCSPQCGVKYRAIRRRILYHFNDSLPEIVRLDKLGLHYTFPEQFDKLNALYNLEG